MSRVSMKITWVFLLIFIAPFQVRSVSWQALGIVKGVQNHYRESPFNPDGFSVQQLDLRKHEYGFSQYLSLSAPVLGLDWRLDLSGAVSHAADWDKDLQVQQFYLQKDFRQNWGLMAGKALLRWGTGYAFNPSDVVAPAKELSDPDNTEKRLAGNDLVKVEYFGPDYSLALVYLTDIEVDKKPIFKTSKLALRGYKNFWGLDLSLISLLNRDQTPILAGNFSYVFGERLELHGEWASQRGNYQPYHRAVADTNTFYRDNPLQPGQKHDHRFFNRFLIGTNYTLPLNILWVSEYYHQDQGYSGAEWRRMIDYVRFLQENFNTPFGAAARGNFLWSLDVLSANGSMRDYWMNHINVPMLANLEFKATALTNLNDASFVLIPETNWTLKNRFVFYLRSFIFRGSANSEYGALFRSWTLEGGTRIQL